MKIIVTGALGLAIGFIVGQLSRPKPAVPVVPNPLMAEVSDLIGRLARDDGFLDEDAVKVSVFMLEKLRGEKYSDSNLITRISYSEPRRICVYAAYDNGLVSTGYEFEFLRGDPGRGMGYASFHSVESIPGE